MSQNELFVHMKTLKLDFINARSYIIGLNGTYMPTLERLKAVGERGRTQNGAFYCILDIKFV
jgi:hypothetical protein